MTALLEGPDISVGHSLPNLDGQAFIGFRACLGASFVDAEFAQRFAEAKHVAPGIVTLDYIFLAGPKRGQMMATQIAYYAKAHKADLSCLDWERDSYQQGGSTVDMGIQPFASVLQGVKLGQAAGLNPGVYMSRYLATPQVVDSLIAAGVPFLWVAAYSGLSLPDWIRRQCAAQNVILIHQYTGTGLDRSRVIVGTLQQLHALAGRPPASGDAPSTGDQMTNLFPLTAHRVVDLPAGAVLQKTPGGDIYTHLTAPTTLGLLGATATHFHVADGDAGVYVARVGLATRVADQSVGA